MNTIQLPKIYDERIINEFEKRWGFDMSDRLFMACYVGSISHGTNLNEHSLDDVDMMAIIVPPITNVVGMKEWTHDTIMVDELDVVFYSVRKYMGLLIKANPNVVGTLFLEENMYMWRSRPWHKWMVPNRSMFSTMEAYGSFCGYASSQLARLQRGVYHGYMGEERKALVDKYGYDIKNAAHVIRLYRMGIEYLESGNLQVFRPDREELKAIKRGEWTLEQVLEEAGRLDEKIKKVRDTSNLPESVDVKVIDDLLVKIHMYFFKEDEDEAR